MTQAKARDRVYRGRRFEGEIIELCVRWYITYRLSYRDLVDLIHGPRQCGKTTLALQVGKRRRFRYYTFDDAATLAAARSDITGFVSRLEKHAILDEVQHVPELFAALKPRPASWQVRIVFHGTRK
jgi:predicted AAA+ superfamily ATPase